MTTKAIDIVEVGVRDGLQNEAKVFPTQVKLDLIGKLLDAGVRRLEVASFVHPKLVPQMADAEAVVAGLPKREDVTFIGLVLNERGLQRALATDGIDEIGAVAVASDAFGEKNQGQTSKESVAISKTLIKLAKDAGLRAQVTISASFGCPFEGVTPVEKVLDIVSQLAEAEPFEIALADTIGFAVPTHVEDVFQKAREKAPGISLRGHFHNTRDTAVANCWAAYKAGAEAMDSSIGGLGGCPFAPKATGNVATEEVAFLFQRSGVETGLNLEKLIAANKWLEPLIGKPLPSLVSRAGNFGKGKDRWLLS